MHTLKRLIIGGINPLYAKLNPICHLLALLGARHILHVSRIRVKLQNEVIITTCWNKFVFEQIHFVIYLWSLFWDDLINFVSNFSGQKLSACYTSTIETRVFSRSGILLRYRYASLNDGDTFREMRR